MITGTCVSASKGKEAFTRVTDLTGPPGARSQDRLHRVWGQGAKRAGALDAGWLSRCLTAGEQICVWGGLSRDHLK